MPHIIKITINYIKENISRIIYDPEARVSYSMPFAKQTEAKINQWCSVKLKRFYSTKETRPE